MSDPKTEQAIIADYLVLKPKFHDLGLSLWFDKITGTFHINNGQDMSEDNIEFQCRTTAELAIYLAGLEAGTKLKFYNRRFQRWEGELLKGKIKEFKDDKKKGHS